MLPGKHGSRPKQGEINMTKKLEVTGKLATFRMSIQGGALPDSFKAVIDVEMDFTGAPLDAVFKCCASGQSARVALQADLRKKTVKELTALGNNGLKVLFTDIMAGNITKPIDKIMALSLEDFVDMMVDEFDMTSEQAHALYYKKHGIDSLKEAITE